MDTPKELGYHFPAEWEKHEATWLTFPYHEDSFPGILDEATDAFMKMVKILSPAEKVRINVHDATAMQKIHKLIECYGIPLEAVEFFEHPSDDVWCRDHGPAFLIRRDAEEEKKKIVVDWEFNAWGNKYAFKNDNAIAGLIARHYRFPLFRPGIVMEGGSVELNGNGTLLTTRSCLLDKNRNPHLGQHKIEWYLEEFYGVNRVLWLDGSIAGDDTNGHIDNITRFVSENKVVTMVEPDRGDVNHDPLKRNLNMLKTLRMPDGRPPEIVEIPMPDPVFYNNRRLPASYANFYIANNAVIVPVFNCRNDEIALNILSLLFPGRKIEPIESNALVWGFGSFHCLTQQEPAV